MKSTAHIKGHPIHPMLIPYPFALLSAGTLFDLGAQTDGRTSWAQTAAHMTRAGLVSALAAAVPGIVDYFGSVPPGSRARRSATRHAICNVSGLVCFLLADGRRTPGGRLPPEAMALSICGTALLGVGGWLGGELVYHERIGVDDEGHAAPTLPPAGGHDRLPGNGRSAAVSGGSRR